jgi:hypothetical protein
MYRIMKKTTDEKIHEIYTVLVGDNLHPDGLISKVSRNEKKIKKHDGYFAVVIGVVTVLSIIAGFGKSIINLFK